MPQLQTTTSAPNTAIDMALLLTLSTLWGASYTFIKIGVTTIPPVTFIAARTLIAGTALLLWMRMQSLAMPRDPAVWRRFLVQALLNSVVPFTLIAWAERSVDASLATILNSASPVLAFLGTWLFTRHEPITPRKGLGVIADLAGICLVVGVSAFDGLGHQLLIFPQIMTTVERLKRYISKTISETSWRGEKAIERSIKEAIEGGSAAAGGQGLRRGGVGCGCGSADGVHMEAAAR